MHPDLQKLIQLQRVDQELATIRRDIDSLPAEETKRRAQLAALQRSFDEAHKKLTESELKTREIEVGVKGCDDEIVKLQGRLSLVRNNAEYQATLLQIESVKRDRDQLEEEGLAVLEGMDELRTVTDAAKAALEAEQGVFETFLTEADKLRTERASEVGAAEDRRQAAATEVAPTMLELYERMFKTRGSMAVCSVEGEVCTGCYTSIKPNDLARLKGGSSIVQCGSCQRILYLTE